MVSAVSVSACAIMVIPNKGTFEYTVTETTSFANKLWVI